MSRFLRLFPILEARGGSPMPGNSVPPPPQGSYPFTHAGEHYAVQDTGAYWELLRYEDGAWTEDWSLQGGGGLPGLDVAYQRACDAAQQVGESVTSNSGVRVDLYHMWGDHDAIEDLLYTARQRGVAVSLDDGYAMVSAADPRAVTDFLEMWGLDRHVVGPGDRL